MSTDEELNEVVTGFRAAESGLRALTEEAEKLQTASQALADADSAVRASASELTATAKELAELSTQLGELSSNLADTAELLRAADPEGVKRELERGVDQTERLRSRIDETAGENRSHLNAIERSLTQVKILAGLAAAALQQEPLP